MVVDMEMREITGTLGRSPFIRGLALATQVAMFSAPHFAAAAPCYRTSSNQLLIRKSVMWPVSASASS